MRWIVGDVQGCALELDDLLQAIAFDGARDELWSVGDLVNRGPDSLATLRLFDSVRGRAVIGNHEVYAINVAAGRWPRKQDTLHEILHGSEGEAWLAWMRALPCLVRLAPEGDAPETFVVHAGVHPHWRDLAGLVTRLDAVPHDDEWLDSEELAFTTRVRCCDAEGKRHPFAGRLEDRPTGVEPWFHHYAGAAQIVHGHWAYLGFHHTGRVIGLDSGCVYGGPLTAWSVEEARAVTVPSRKPHGHALG